MGRRRREPRWLRDLADGAWASSVLWRPRELQQAIEREAARRGMDPWQLTRQIARCWQQEGRIATLEPGGGRQ